MNPAAVNTRWRLGFTLVEMLLVLGLIGLLSTLSIAATTSALEKRAKSSEEIFWTAVGEASRQAMKSDHVENLTVQQEGTVLAVQTEGHSHYFPLRQGDSLQFLSEKSHSSMLLAGQLVEAGTLGSLRFFADGTCEPCKIQIREGTSEARHFEIDPWTCAPILSKSSPE